MCTRKDVLHKFIYSTFRFQYNHFEDIMINSKKGKIFCCFVLQLFTFVDNVDEQVKKRLLDASTGQQTWR